MNYAIGCFYKFEKCAIAKAEIIDYQSRKIRLFFECYTNKSITNIAKRLKAVGTQKHIWIKKHESLKSRLGSHTNEISFKDEEILEELDDIYKSMIHDEIINLEEISDKFNVQMNHHVYALQLALKGLNYYQPSYDDLLHS